MRVISSVLFPSTWRRHTVKNKKHLKEATEKLYQSIADEAQKPKESGLPKDWSGRIIKSSDA